MPIRKGAETDEVIPDDKMAEPQQVKAAKPATQKEKVVKLEDGKAGINYSISFTKNIGKYESVKINVGITIPLGADDEMLKRLDELMVVGREKVMARLGEDLKQVTDALT